MMRWFQWIVVPAAVAAVALLISYPTQVRAGSYDLLHILDDPSATTTDNFGNRAAVDAGRILVGDAGDDTLGTNRGRAHLFDAGTGALLRTFEHPHGSTANSHGEYFGKSLALDGDRALIAGNIIDDTTGDKTVTAYLMDVNTGSVLQTLNNPTPSTGDLYGIQVALDGDRAAVSASRDGTQGANVGQVYLFDTNTGQHLRTFDDPTVTTADQFGHAIDLDGDRLLVGAFTDDTQGDADGQAHLFDINTGNLLHTFDDPTPGTNSDREEFGRSVALDGDNVLIGVKRGGNEVGEAMLFDAVTGNLLHTFNDPTPTSGDWFGFEVDIKGPNILISVIRDGTLGTHVGQAFLFGLDGQRIATFNDPTVTTADEFSISVAVDHNLAVIGARSDDTLGTDVGQVYVFSIPEPASALMLLGWVGACLLRRRRQTPSPVQHAG